MRRTMRLGDVFVQKVPDSLGTLANMAYFMLL